MQTVNSKLSRRKFIQFTGVLGGGLAIGLSLDGCYSRNPLPEYPAPDVNNTFGVVNGAPIGEYIHIKPDGSVFINIVRLEMGQGAVPGVMAIFTEEMDADWEKVQVVYSDPIAGLENWTGGSTSTFREWETMRQAGALIRQLMLETASRQWNASITECKAEKGFVYRKGSNKSLSYGELAANVEFRDIEGSELKLKDPADFKLIGTDFQNRIIPDMVQGKHPYGMDLRLEGMSYASIERAPTFDAKLVSYDGSESMKVPGVQEVVSYEGFVVDGSTHVRTAVAVVATNNWAAMEGRKRLKVEWERGPKADIVQGQFEEEAHRRLGVEKGRQVFLKGDKGVLEKSERKFSQTYEFPYQHHACMEVLNATGRFDGDGCEVWVGTQASERASRNISKFLNVPYENVKLHCHPAGGGFGLRFWAAPEMEALLVSREARGKTVQILYTREDDVQFDFLNPLEINQYSVAIQNDKVKSWHMKTAIDNWGGTCAWMIYDIPNLYAEEIRLEGFTQMSAWRSVMANAEGFSMECFIDEVAEELGKDPLTFRKEMLKPGTEAKLNHEFPVNIDRILNVLDTVAKKAEWGRTMPANSGQGIAVYPYMHGNGYAAAVAEVEVMNSRVDVKKVTIAIDCGLVINPDFVKKQMEGGIIWALSALLYGNTEYENGSVTRSNFHDNKVLRNNETPEIVVHICESPDQKPWGVGEIAPPVTYPAVCNAIFAATGKRIRKLPVAI